jgi:hypothetical protein
MKLGSYIQGFTSGVQSPSTIKLLRNSLILVTAYLILVLCLPNAQLFWGEHSLMPSLGFPDSWRYKIIMALHQDGYGNLYPLFFLSIGLGGVLYFFNGFNRIATFLVWLGVIVLYNRAYLSMVGGNYLLQSLLFFLIFADESSHAKGKWKVISDTLSNLALWACKLQVIYVYIFSGAYKLASEQWMSGEAVFDILHLKEFSLPLIMEYLDSFHGILVIIDYVAIAYFILFPFLIWSKKWKVPLLIFGVIWHLGMGWGIGVMDFSFIMISSYAAFLEEDDIIVFKRLFTRRIKVGQT